VRDRGGVTSSLILYIDALDNSGTNGNCWDRTRHVVFRLGSSRMNPDDLIEGLDGTSTLAKRRVSLRSHEISEIRRRQTDSFRPGANGCRVEVDCHFVMA
jgi:hypothetical protein